MNLTDTYLLVFCYLTAATAVIFFSRKKQKNEWKAFLVTNLLAILLGSILFYFRSANIFLTLLADWSPLFLIFFFYQNAGLLSRAIYKNTFDDHIIRLEKKLFRFYYPCIDLSETFDSFWFSEFLHLCYFSYFFLLYGVPLYFYIKGNYAAFYQFEFAELCIILAGFFTHMFVPVLSPRTIFEKIKSPLKEGRMYRLTHMAVEKGFASGTAFPSVHVAVGTLMLLISWHMGTLFFYVVSFFSLGLIISTIYGRFHYVIDMVFGILYACLVFTLVYF